QVELAQQPGEGKPGLLLNRNGGMLARVPVVVPIHQAVALQDPPRLGRPVPRLCGELQQPEVLVLELVAFEHEPPPAFRVGAEMRWRPPRSFMPKELHRPRRRTITFHGSCRLAVSVWGARDRRRRANGARAWVPCKNDGPLF